MGKTRRISLCAITLILIALASVAAQSQQLPPSLQAAIGHWQVINDEGQPGGQVETYLVDGKLSPRSRNPAQDAFRGLSVKSAQAT